MGTAHYDIVIVGAGPAGLTLAQGCAQAGKRVAVVEREATIGGCHRVRRVDGLYTEHGPRMYMSSYKTVDNVLKQAGFSRGLGAFFEPMIGFNIYLTDIEPRNWDLAKLVWPVLFRSLGSMKDETVQEWCVRHRCHPSTSKYLDRMCRFTDGAGADRYTMYKLVQLYNQGAFYRPLKPVVPNDKGLLPAWQASLEAMGVTFLTGHEVTDLRYDGDKVTSVVCGTVEVRATDKIVLAVPPESFGETFLASKDPKIANAFGPKDKVHEWVEATRYIDYIPITFHYSDKRAAPKQITNRDTPWGVVCARYEYENSVVLSSIASLLDAPSPHTGKSIQQTRSKEEIAAEVFRQLQVGERPDATHVSPGVFWKEDEGVWEDIDSAFIKVPKQEYIENQCPGFTNLYTVGCHNGNHVYAFTSMESAVANACHLIQSWFPSLVGRYRISKPIELRFVLVVAAVVLALVMLVAALVVMWRRS